MIGYEPVYELLEVIISLLSCSGGRTDINLEWELESSYCVTTFYEAKCDAI